MTDKPDPAAPIPTEQIPSVGGGISVLASAQAPFIYVDGVASFGVYAGAVNITLQATRFMPVPGSNDVVGDRVIVGHLRMTESGFRHLKEAVDGIDLLLKPVDGIQGH
jgi:hypothetical protein